MKLKSLSLVAGAIALTLTASPFVAKAQNTSGSTPSGVEAPHNERGHLQKLNLSDKQKSQFDAIRSNTQKQIEAILTPEQLKKFQAEQQARQERRQQRLAQGQGQRPQGERPEGKRRGDRFADLNLTADQQSQIQKIIESSKQHIQQVLTPEQQQQIKQFRDNHHSHRQQGNR